MSLPKIFFELDLLKLLQCGLEGCDKRAGLVDKFFYDLFELVVGGCAEGE